MEKVKLFNGDEINQRTILGHPSGLFTLFFTGDVGKIFLLWYARNTCIISYIISR
jgi:hypothetical protein